MFTPAQENSILCLNGLDAVRRDRIHNADPGGWFLCVAIPPWSGPLHTQSPAMSPNPPPAHPDGRDGSWKHLVPPATYRILDTATQMAQSALAISHSRHPEAIRVHSISALVWLFRLRRAFGPDWPHDTSLIGRRRLCERLYHLRRLVARCHDSTLSRIAATAPFSDIPTDQTGGWDPALYDDERYRLLTDNDLVRITQPMRELADGIRAAVVALRRSLWAELDRVQDCPPSPSIKDPDEVDAFFRSDQRSHARAERNHLKKVRGARYPPGQRPRGRRNRPMCRTRQRRHPPGRTASAGHWPI